MACWSKRTVFAKVLLTTFFVSCFGDLHELQHDHKENCNHRHPKAHEVIALQLNRLSGENIQVLGGIYDTLIYSHNSMKLLFISSRKQQDKSMLHMAKGRC